MWLFTKSEKDIYNYFKKHCPRCGVRTHDMTYAVPTPEGYKLYCKKCYPICNPPEPKTVEDILKLEEERKLLDYLTGKYADSMTPEQWRRLPREVRQSKIQDAKNELRKVQEREHAEWDAEWAERQKAEKKKQDAIDDSRRDKEYEQEKRKQAQMTRDQERKKERDERELQKDQEKARKQQEADAIKQAEEERWAPRPFKP
jgi:hypothetical protein